MYVFWFNFILGLNYISLCLKLVIIHYHTQKQTEIKFKPSIKLSKIEYIYYRNICNFLDVSGTFLLIIHWFHFLPLLVEISCEPPNNRLDKFKGKLMYEEKMYPLENENVILRVRWKCIGSLTCKASNIVVFGPWNSVYLPPLINVSPER